MAATQLTPPPSPKCPRCGFAIQQDRLDPSRGWLHWSTARSECEPQPQGELMAITEPQSAPLACPDWCEGCTPPEKGGYGHLGVDEVVRTILVEPRRYDGPLHGVPVWEPSELTVYLEQPFGALLPIVRVDKGDGIEDQLLMLTVEEAQSLAEALLRLVDDTRRSVRDKTEAVGSA